MFFFQKSILPLFLLLLIFGCSVKDGSIDRKTITGIIYTAGNAPFSRLALRTANDSTYLLKCNAKTDSLLYDNQGIKFEIIYEGVTDSAGIKILNVSEARLVSSE